MSTMSMRLSGPPEALDTLLDVLRGSPGVEDVLEIGAAEAPRMSGDSSSAGLAESAHLSAREVEVHAINEAASDNVRNRAEMAAHDAGVVVEWLEPL